MRRVYWSLIGLGVILLVPLAWRHSRPAPLSVEDERTAFEPLARISLNVLERPGVHRLRVAVPSDAAWRRIRLAWGDPGYIVAAVQRDRRFMYSFDTLGLTVLATVGSEPIALEPAVDPLYLYSAWSRQCGLHFQASAGSSVDLQVDARGGQMPRGDLIVTAHWTAETKDRLVGLIIQRDLGRIYGALAIGGATLIAAAAVLLMQSHRP
jgi:hypothetical protein